MTSILVPVLPHVVPANTSEPFVSKVTLRASYRTQATWGKVLTHWVSPSTPFFNLKGQEGTPQRCTCRCARVSRVAYNALVLTKEPSQENYYGFEREISGHMLPQGERVCFSCGNWLGHCWLGWKEIFLSDILLNYRKRETWPSFPWKRKSSLI